MQHANTTVSPCLQHGSKGVGREVQGDLGGAHFVVRSKQIQFGLNFAHEQPHGVNLIKASQRPTNGTGRLKVSLSPSIMTQPRAVICAVARTPIGKFMGSYSSMSAVDLGVATVKELLRERTSDPASGVVDEVIFGQVLQAGAGQIQRGKWR